MSLEIPTTQQLSENLIAQLEASLSQTIPLLPKAFCRVLAKAISGQGTLLYKYCGFIFLQLFVRHASAQETVINGKTLIPLVEWGRAFGAGDPIAAVRAEHIVTVTVLDQTGDLVAGQLLVRSETGITYRVIASIPLDGAEVFATIRAVSDQDGGDGSGDIGNLEVGDVVTFANSPPNVATEAVVSQTTITGADAEDPEVYRARVLRLAQAQPQGGAYADYREWGEGVAGIAHIYPYTGFPGEVDVYVEATVESAGDPDGIPTQDQLDAVAAAIELDDEGLATRRPANAAVNVLSIIRTAFDVEVNTLDGEDITALEDAIETGLDEYLRTREPYIVGLSVLPRLDRITRAAVSGVVDTIVSAAGGTIASVRLLEDGSPIDSRTLEIGEKAKLGTVTYV